MEMDTKFYKNCILEDRKTRRFSNFSKKQWFKEFSKLAIPETMERTAFRKGLTTWRENVKTLEESDRTLEIYAKYRRAFKDLKDEWKYIKEFSLSKEMLDLAISIDPYILFGFLCGAKRTKFGNIEEVNKRRFPEIDLPLIRMMDYFLEKRAFRQLSYVMERLEYRYVALWIEITRDLIEKTIQANIEQPDVFYFFSQLRRKDFRKFFKKEYLFTIEKADAEAIYNALQHEVLPKKYIDSQIFLKRFKELPLSQQIGITDLMEAKELAPRTIRRFHRALNKKEQCETSLECLYNTFQMNKERTFKLLKTIKQSSYFRKNNIENSKEWKEIATTWNYISLGLIPKKTCNYYSKTMKLYKAAREYATSSIASSLYPLNQLTEKVTYIKNVPFNVLARARTGIYESKKLSDTFKERTFCSFSVLTPKNMSHYGDRVLYGYFTNVSADLIAHIYPEDSLSNAWARYESDLTDRYNMLLDIDDLNQATLENKTYNQLCIKTKTKTGEILWPDVIICIDEIDEKSQAIADALNLKIAVLVKNEDTIENNEDIYRSLQ